MRIFFTSSVFALLGAITIFWFMPYQQVNASNTDQTDPAPQISHENKDSSSDVNLAGTLQVQSANLIKREIPPWQKYIGFLGIIIFLSIAFFISNAKKKINWVLVFWGLGLQLTFALFIFQPLWMCLVSLTALILISQAITGFQKKTLWPSVKRPSIYMACLLFLIILIRFIFSQPTHMLHKYIFIEPIGKIFFNAVNVVALKLLSFTDAGTNFLMRNISDGQVAPGLMNFVFQVLPTIIFFSALMSVMYHLGVMQLIVSFMARIMQKTMGTSGAESMSAAANIFVGQTEAPLVIKPYVNEMTMSELMAIMTGGFATVAGGVLAAYVGILKGYFPSIAGHLMAASIMNAPAGLVCAKLMIPETGTPKTTGKTSMNVERPDANVIGAAARGASEGMTLVLNVAAMLLAFIALIAMLNYGISLLGKSLNSTMGMFGFSITAIIFYVLYVAISQHSKAIKRIVGAATVVLITIWWVIYGIKDPQPIDLTLQLLLGIALKPVAWLMGIPWEDATVIGTLLGEKLVLNEFYAYAHLGSLLQEGTSKISMRAVAIVTYALLGFANFSSIAIQIGGIGGIAPTRRQDLAKLGLKAMIAGTLAAYISACIAGIMIG